MRSFQPLGEHSLQKLFLSLQHQANQDSLIKSWFDTLLLQIAQQIPSLFRDYALRSLSFSLLVRSHRKELPFDKRLNLQYRLFRVKAKHSIHYHQRSLLLRFLGFLQNGQLPSSLNSYQQPLTNLPDSLNQLLQFHQARYRH